MNERFWPLVDASVLFVGGDHYVGVMRHRWKRRQTRHWWSRWSRSTPGPDVKTTSDLVVEAEEEPPALSFAGLHVRDDTVLGDEKGLDLYDATAWVGGVGEFPRHLRTALSGNNSPRDDRPQLVVYVPSGGLLRRSVAPEQEAEARTFATRLNAASNERKRSWDGSHTDPTAAHLFAAWRDP